MTWKNRSLSMSKGSGKMAEHEPNEFKALASRLRAHAKSRTLMAEYRPIKEMDALGGAMRLEDDLRKVAEILDRFEIIAAYDEHELPPWREEDKDFVAFIQKRAHERLGDMIGAIIVKDGHFKVRRLARGRHPNRVVFEGEAIVLRSKDAAQGETAP